MVQLSVDNTILNNPYRFFGSVKDLREQFKEEWIEFLYKYASYNQSSLILNTAPNRIGKTITTLKFFHDESETYDEIDWVESGYRRTLYLTDRHRQITEVKNTLKELDLNYFRQWWGIKYSCQRKSEPLHKFLLDNHVTSGVICQNCYLKDNCRYWLQFKVIKGYIVGAPKEFLPTKYIQKKQWDSIVVDEVLDKARKIYPTCPEIPEEVFTAYGISETLYYLDYETVKDFTENILKYQTLQADIKKSAEEFLGLDYDLVYQEDTLKERWDYLKAEGGLNQFHVLNKLTRKLRKESDLIYDPGFNNLMKFYNNLNTTTEWLEYCFMYGFRPHFYKPYLDDVFDLQGKHRSNIIILNTSLDRPIFDCLTEKQRTHFIPINEFTFNIVNKDSRLLHYNMLFRSCRKGSLFETDDFGRINFGEDGLPIVKKGYGKEVIEMAKNIADFGRARNLRVGLITYKEAEELFKPHVNVIGHFGGHQGSNAFDDVDLLVIVGTYHLNQTALYHKHYIIHNEFLGDNPAKWNKSQYVNGVRINLSDNEKLNQVKLYKLKEEHQQAIFRSGANVYPGKMVVVFGYVPPGVEEVLDYRIFNSNRGLKISLSKWLKKSETQKQDV
ncbi:MAG: hypothetical protein APG12_01537 [Candidatus Methanofastidiosum methylothiophilum]|uniref:Uncharacterized protein n=1 Tax=Candidatus Methanofastidiosum methylothiophilum TaxID=1705564 RepID=A0A150IIS1_9EURY|nr:MAG: hypothetical protein APG10_01387 [Candidatus Methanofastidiosum methylthiophilus]KYC49341.1 MAG: hypothetical protein APG12_01537 [Candidatus Methanofastidiosum methylthiophilus]